MDLQPHLLISNARSTVAIPPMEWCKIDTLPDELKRHIWSFVQDDIEIKYLLLKHFYPDIKEILREFITFRQEKYILGTFYNYFPRDRTKFSYLVVDSIEYHRTHFNLNHIELTDWTQEQHREDCSDYHKIVTEIEEYIKNSEKNEKKLHRLYKLYRSYVILCRNILNNSLSE